MGAAAGHHVRVIVPRSDPGPFLFAGRVTRPVTGRFQNVMEPGKENLGQCRPRVGRDKEA